MSNDGNILSGLGDSLGDLLFKSLESSTDILVKGFCKITNTETKYLREKKLEEGLDRLQKENRINELKEKIQKRQDKIEENKRIEKVNNKNKVSINGEQIDFSDLWFNVGLRNKSHDVPVLQNYKITEICMIFTFELPVGITKSQIDEKKEEISYFFMTHENNIDIRKYKNKIDLVVLTYDIFEKTFKYSPELIQSTDGLKIPFGYFLAHDYTLKLMTIDFANEGNHAMLISGTSGSGKSSVLRTILLHSVLNYSPKQLQIVVFAGSGDTDFLYLKETNHLVNNKIYTDIDEIVGQDEKKDKSGNITQEAYNGILDDIKQEIEDRLKTFTSANVKDIDEYHRKGHKMSYKIVVFDEYSYFFGEDKFERLQAIMGKLAQTCRKTGIKIIISLQDAQNKYYTPAIKYNVPLKIGLKAMNESHSKNICDKTGLEDINRVGECRFFSAFNMPIGKEHIAFKSLLSSNDNDILIKMIKDPNNHFYKQ